MFTNRIRCEAIEIADLRAYLHSTPVSWLCKVIDAGGFVHKADVNSVVEVGDLETIFECLGGIKSQESHGKKRFLVRHVMDTLRDPACTDTKMLQAITEYERLLGANELEIRITLFESVEGIVLHDGNKRTVACFERAKAENRELVLPVYVISDPRLPTSATA